MSRVKFDSSSFFPTRAPLVSPCSPAQGERFLLFSGVENFLPPGDLSPPHVRALFESICMKKLSHTLVGSRILVPCELPGEGEFIDLYFLSSVNCWVCEIMEVAQKSMFVFVPLFSFGEDVISGFSCGSRYSFAVSPGMHLIVVEPSSALASMGPPAKSSSCVSSSSVISSVEPDEDAESLQNVKEARLNVSSAGKPFYDLDGVKRYCLDSSSLCGVKDLFALFRLLDEDRRQAFMVDYKIEPECVQRTICMFRTWRPDVNSSFCSVNNAADIFDLPVWVDLVLFGSFLSCNYNPFDWNKLCIQCFLAPVDRNYLWTDQASRPGRDRLAKAVQNLGRMCYVIFGDPFLGAFDALTEFLGNAKHNLQRFHDIFLRFHVEVCVFTFFNEVRSFSISRFFPGMPMKNPLQCVALLQRHIQACCDNILRSSLMPHTEWYGLEGDACSIVLDPDTYSMVQHKLPFQRRFEFRYPSVVQSSHHKQVVVDPLPATIRGARNHEAALNSSPSVTVSGCEVPVATPRLCIWDILRQLGITSPLTGDLFPCRRTNCPNHLSLRSIKHSQVLKFSQSLRYPAELRDLVLISIKSNPDKFALH